MTLVASPTHYNQVLRLVLVVQWFAAVPGAIAARSPPYEALSTLSVPPDGAVSDAASEDVSLLQTELRLESFNLSSHVSGDAGVMSAVGDAVAAAVHDVSQLGLGMGLVPEQVHGNATQHKGIDSIIHNPYARSHALEHLSAGDAARLRANLTGTRVATSAEETSYILHMTVVLCVPICVAAFVMQCVPESDSDDPSDKAGRLSMDVGPGYRLSVHPFDDMQHGPAQVSFIDGNICQTKQNDVLTIKDTAHNGNVIAKVHIMESEEDGHGVLVEFPPGLHKAFLDTSGAHQTTPGIKPEVKVLPFNSDGAMAEPVALVRPMSVGGGSGFEATTPSGVVLMRIPVDSSGQLTIVYDVISSSASGPSAQVAMAETAQGGMGIMGIRLRVEAGVDQCFIMCLIMACLKLGAQVGPSQARWGSHGDPNSSRSI